MSAPTGQGRAMAEVLDRAGGHSPPTRAEQVLLVVFVCLAVAAFGASYSRPAAWIFWLPAVISPFWRLERLPTGGLKAARYAAWILLALATALGLILMAYPVILSPKAMEALTLTAGYGLAGLCALFALGTPLWNPADTLIPASMGLIAVACFNPAAPIRPLIVAPGGVTLAYLFFSKRKRGWLRELLSTRLAMSVLASGLLAWVLYAGLPRLQARVEDVSGRWFGAETDQASQFGLRSRLGELAELKLSRRVALRVWTSRPQKLRGRVYTRFDGQTWQARITSQTPLAAAPAGLAAGWLEEVPGTPFLLPGLDAQFTPAGAVETRILEGTASSAVLVSPANKLLARAPLASLRADAFETLIPPPSVQVSLYGVVNRPYRARGDAVEQDPDVLALPPALDPRWGALASRLAKGTTSVEERVAKTVGYVQHAATYSLEVGSFHSQQPVSEFFFEKKRGYCQYFASAAAILLRLEDIPARYVTGYNVQEFNRPGGHWVVRLADAHAWLEVFVPGRGWVETDPTPEAEFEARRQANAEGWLGQSGEWLAATATETWTRVRQGDWRGAVASLRLGTKTALRAMVAQRRRLFLLVVIAVLTAMLALIWLRGTRRPRRRRPAATPAARSLLEQTLGNLQRAWEDAGFPRPASRGLLEHWHRIPPEKLSPEFRELSRRLVDLYYAVSFGKQQFSPEELRELERFRLTKPPPSE